MKYYSTRNKKSRAEFKNALLRGLAPDGGLYMPAFFPKAKQSKRKTFSSLSAQILEPFIDIPPNKLALITKDAFNFQVPLIELQKNLFVLELFHGPTLSFKDFGARFMARVINYYLKRGKERLTIIVATSGDTGSAVASGFYGLSNVNVVVLYPHKRISNLQEQQIATYGKNVTAVAVRGDFDDCQKLAKKALNDASLRKSLNLSSANSINIGRLLPQMSHYWWASQQLNLQKFAFVVPSGNFGNVTAGLFAKKTGLKSTTFISAVNKNSKVPEYLRTGNLRAQKTKQTFSNAMDVGRPSNFERILDLYEKKRKKIKNDLKSISVSERETQNTIKRTYKELGYTADPHTAVGLATAFKLKTSAQPLVVLGTAHPAKFKKSVEKIIKKRIQIPSQLKKVMKKKKKRILLDNKYKDLRSLLEK